MSVILGFGGNYALKNLTYTLIYILPGRWSTRLIYVHGIIYLMTKTFPEGSTVFPNPEIRQKRIGHKA